MPVTVRFNPTANSQQAAIIPNATLKNDGVMTKEMVAALEAAAGGGGGGVPIVKDYFSGAEFEKGQWNVANPAAQGTIVITDSEFNVGALQCTPQGLGGILSIAATRPFFLPATFSVNVYLRPVPFQSLTQEDLLYAKFSLKDSGANDVWSTMASKDSFDVSNTNWILSTRLGDASINTYDSGVAVDDSIYSLFQLTCVDSVLTAKLNGVPLPASTFGPCVVPAGVYFLQYESQSGATQLMQFRSAGVALLATL